MGKRKREEPPPPGRYRPFRELEVPAAGKAGPPEPPRDRKAAEDKRAEPGDEDLFRQAVGDVRRMPGSARPGPEREPRPAPIPDEEQEWTSYARDLERGAAAFDVRWSHEYIEGKRTGVDRDTMAGLRRGRIAWQEYIDLHGLTRGEAREAVERFIVNTRSRGVRCVLIVHGRGKGSEGGIPVLKEKLKAWLSREGGIGSHMLAFTSARPCDGGVGAVYVLLRKPDGTSKGRART